MRLVQKDNFEQDICIWIVVIEFINLKNKFIWKQLYWVN